MNAFTFFTTATPLGPTAVEIDDDLVPMAGAHVRLGFPSPAEDFIDDEINLHRYLVERPAATYLYRADGWSMSGIGINDGDILVVDRSVKAQDGDLVLAIWDGNQPTCKVLRVLKDHIELHSAHPDHPPIVLDPVTEVEVFAVIGVVRKMQRRPHVCPR